jgi:molecular chaperone GrpE
MKDEEQKEIIDEIIEEDAAEEMADDVEFIEEDSEGVELSTQAKLKKLREELKACQKERTEYLTGWQRSQADYINLKKEAEERLKRGKELGREQMMDSLLPALDAFDMAIGNKEAWEKVEPTWRQGIEYIYSRLVSALAENNMEVIDGIGVLFDPTLHEAIENIPTDDESLDHTIAAIIQKGYKMGERVLRPARVKVYVVNQ